MAEAPQEEQQHQQLQEEEEEEEQQLPSSVETSESDEGSEEPNEVVRKARPLLSMRSMSTMSTIDPDDDYPNMIVFRKNDMYGKSIQSRWFENSDWTPAVLQEIKQDKILVKRVAEGKNTVMAGYFLKKSRRPAARCIGLKPAGLIIAVTQPPPLLTFRHYEMECTQCPCWQLKVGFKFGCSLGLLSWTTKDEESKSSLMVSEHGEDELIEDIITLIQDETEGVPIRTVKSFMTKIPSVVTGADIVQWLMKNLSIEDPAEAMHIGSLIAAQGYFFPISDHVLCLKDDGTLYRFQAPYFWPSNCWEPENTDYAIYLCKRTMQNKTRLELADYEAENLARLQRAFARKWEFIYMQAEAQVKIDRKKDKTERKILDSQERAFWDVHRPVPGCVNTTEMDIRKCRRMKNPHRVKKSVYSVVEEGRQSQSPIHTSLHHCRKGTKDDVEKEILFLNTQLDRHCLKMSKVAESLIIYTEQFMEYDPFVTTPEPSNPWTSDDPTLWDLETSKEPSQQRVKKWGFSLEEALKDPAGQDLFLKFLESEFSSENLRFWLAVQGLKKVPQQDVAQRVQDIWAEFLAEGAPSSINLDSHSYEITSQNLKDPGRYSYEDAQDHIYKLMKSDSYPRFLRSNVYQDLLMARKKPEIEQGRRTSLEKFTRSVLQLVAKLVGSNAVPLAITEAPAFRHMLCSDSASSVVDMEKELNEREIEESGSSKRLLTGNQIQDTEIKDLPLSDFGVIKSEAHGIFCFSFLHCFRYLKTQQLLPAFIFGIIYI
ncbi:hypothetical protein CCH79_00000524 [Gambusia affinis]|uniref:Regulator of G-protein signaling 6 n=1 Tax=Gambusia affinis TaxID=33528 RepID=A0A315VVI1_GAMAF|nr:hypothetical protein CCH79_00000524 [Gambusia affinis]